MSDRIALILLACALALMVAVIVGTGAELPRPPRLRHLSHCAGSRRRSFRCDPQPRRHPHNSPGRTWALDRVLRGQFEESLVAADGRG